MTDLEITCRRLSDLLAVLPVITWRLPVDGEVEDCGRDEESVKQFWAEVFPRWASGGDYVPSHLALARRGAELYASRRDSAGLEFTTRYISVFFGDDALWDEKEREAIASQLRGRAEWADCWRREVLAAAYEIEIYLAAEEHPSPVRSAGILKPTLQEV